MTEFQMKFTFGAWLILNLCIFSGFIFIIFVRCKRFKIVICLFTQFFFRRCDVVLPRNNVVIFHHIFRAYRSESWTNDKNIKPNQGKIPNKRFKWLK